MDILLLLLVFVAAYAISKFLLSKVNGLAELVEVLAICIGVAVAWGFRSFGG